MAEVAAAYRCTWTQQWMKRSCPFGFALGRGCILLMNGNMFACETGNLLVYR